MTTTTQAPENIFDSQEFYELMYAYRHAQPSELTATVTNNFEAVKDFCKLHATQQAPAPDLTDAEIHAAAAEIYAAARCLADLDADARGVDKDDNWKIYGDVYRVEATLALKAADIAKQGASMNELLARLDAAELDSMLLDWLDRELACPLTLHDGRYLNIASKSVRQVISEAMKGKL